jgi:hypothetical protein
MVIERSADIVKSDAWIQDCRCVVGPSGFDHDDLRAGRGQFRSQNRTSRPCSHHDEVISPFVIRLVDHFELPESKIFDLLDPFGDGLASATKSCASKDDGSP